ncbi:MAG: NFACT RNA binding domain-containing protein [bacterium]|nr:NFACT RNA binding domain-containing protein [bacterium]
MILDSLTTAALAAELAADHVGQHIRRAHADEAGLDMLLGADGARDSATLLQLRFGPHGSLKLAPGGQIHAGVGRTRYLEGSRIDSIAAVTGDRVLQLQLSRIDAASQRTHGLLHIVLIPPYFRAVLVSQLHGRILGVWAAGTDRHAPTHGTPYVPPASPADRLLPGLDDIGVFVSRLLLQQGPVEQALRLTISGVDRHLATCICTAAGIDPDSPTAGIPPEDARVLWTSAEALWALRGGPVCRWTRGRSRVSVAAPEGSEATVTRYPSVCAALRADAAVSADEAQPGAKGQRVRLARGLRILQCRAAGLQADLDEVATAATLERTGNSLMAAAATIQPGGSGRIPDAHDAAGTVMIDVQLAPGETPVQQGARLLRRGAKMRRRADLLPPKLHRVHELIFETERLLDRLGGAGNLPEDAMERWERRVELRQSPSREAETDRKQTDDRQGARPRRYITSTGWSVWAGRSNHENDIVTHRLAAQNDVWFHAHGYAGSHVILRREGRHEEPSNRTLEEAAGVAAYWSKGRTANKVPVVYTLAKYVSKPRGGAPGLAVMKREKTIMVRPALLAEEEQE